MDAVTMFELEAQRRRETVASDRDQAYARFKAMARRVEATVVEPRLRRNEVAPQVDHEPASLARQTAG